MNKWSFNFLLVIIKTVIKSYLWKIHVFYFINISLWLKKTKNKIAIYSVHMWQKNISLLSVNLGAERSHWWKLFLSKAFVGYTTTFEQVHMLLLLSLLSYCFLPSPLSFCFLQPNVRFCPSLYYWYSPCSYDDPTLFLLLPLVLWCS